MTDNHNVTGPPGADFPAPQPASVPDVEFPAPADTAAVDADRIAETVADYTIGASGGIPPDTVWRPLPVTHIPLGTWVDPVTQTAREKTMAAWLNIDVEYLYQSPLGGPPVLFYPDPSVPRRDRHPELEPETGWFPLLWPTEDQQERYDDETDEEFAARIVIDHTMRGSYNPDSGEWRTIWSIYTDHDNEDNESWTDRVEAWTEGADDEHLDLIDADQLPDGTDPDEPYRRAQLTVDDLYAAVEPVAYRWVREHISFDPADFGVEESWAKLCQATDALQPFDAGNADILDRKMSDIAPIADAAVVAGGRGGFDRQARLLLERMRNIAEGA